MSEASLNVSAAAFVKSIGIPHYITTGKHTKTLQTLVGLGSAALAAAVETAKLVDIAHFLAIGKHQNTADIGGTR